MAVVQPSLGVAVVGAAGQRHVVDVGVAAVAPGGFGVVGLAAVGADGAAGFGAAAVAGDQHDPLRRGSDAFGAVQVQRLAGRAVEHREVVVGVAAHLDDVGDRAAWCPRR